MSLNRLAALTMLAGFALLVSPLRAAPAPVVGVALAELKGITVPEGAYWALAEVAIGRMDRIAHQHGLEFVYTLQGDAAVIIGRDQIQIPQGKAVVIPAGTPHTHLSAGAAGRIVSLVLAPGEASWGTLEVARSRRTGVLAGFRQGAQIARLLDVTIQPSSESAVHTHPGPEGVYVLEGPIVVQTEGKLTVMLRGDLAIVPGDTPVQVRYPGGSGLGRLLAPYIVAEGAPFNVPISSGFRDPPKP